MQENTKPLSRLARAFGYFSLGLGISLLIGYWLKEEERRNQLRSAMQHPQPLNDTPDEPVIILSQKTLDAAEVPVSPSEIAPSPEPSSPGNPPKTDDLTQIKGIGAKTAEALLAAGITSYAALAAANPSTLLSQLQGVRGVSEEKLQAWIEQAQQLQHD